MRILFYANNTCCQTESGGVQVRVRKIKSLLEDRGHSVDFFSAFETNLRDYDVLHVFMLSVECFELIRCAKTLGIKVVVSSILTLEKHGYHYYINTRLTPLYVRLGFYPSDYYVYQSVKYSDYIIAETPAEASFIKKYFHKPSDSVFVIPNGVDELKEADDKIFDVLGNKKKYILQVGRIDPNKNLLNTINAVKGTGYSLVVIGGPFAVGNNEYYECCKRAAEGHGNIHFTGWLKSGSDLLASAYKNSQALILPSFHETFGLVAVEAAMAGCHVCLSNTLPILDFNVFDKTLTFDPKNVQQIRRVIDTAMRREKDNKTKELVKKVFSWVNVIDQHIEIYSK